MLIIPFSLSGSRYAIEAAKVVEILPQVQLRNIPGVPAYVAGMFVCRGTVVPVIDLCRLIYKRPCSRHIGTRMILTAKRDRTLGMLCEEVVETIRVSRESLCPVPLDTENARYLGKLIRVRDELIQLVETEDILDTSVEKLIFGQLNDR